MSKTPRLLLGLDFLAAAGMLGTIGLVFLYAPIERIMGAVQKVFYFHVASAWVGMLGFIVAAAVGVLYLLRRRPILDIAGHAAVEIGLVFSVIAVLAGMTWARPVWNTWWTWDPRLTTAAIMVLVYAAYLILRSGIDDPEQRARFAAVYAIVGAVSVPLTFFSIRLFRTIHPILFGGDTSSSLSDFSTDPRMVLTFFVSLAAFSLLFIVIFWHRIRLGQLAERVSELTSNREEQS
jgi:heme exporter protein C